MQDDCVKKFDEMKLKRAYKYMIFCIDSGEIKVDQCGAKDVRARARAPPRDRRGLRRAEADPPCASPVSRSPPPTRAQADYDAFVDALPEDSPRYGLFDYEFETEDHCHKSKVVFFSWCAPGPPVRGRGRGIPGSDAHDPVAGSPTTRRSDRR